MNTFLKMGFIVLFLLCLSPALFAENYIGIILDGHQEDCTIQSRGEDFSCNESRQLYPGDKVIKKPDTKALKIKWAPYASAKEIDKTTLMVLFEPPQRKEGILKGIKERLDLMRVRREIVVGATRIGEGELKILQPGPNATLLSGNRITFSWESGYGSHIVFKDNKGAEVFIKELKGEFFVQLSTEEIGMKLSEVYTWNVTGVRNNKPFKIRLLSTELAQQINADLTAIDKENISKTEKLIKQAVYLQSMSDAYPKDIDLYWLSYSFMEGLKDENLSEENKALKYELKMNYIRHIREKI